MAYGPDGISHRQRRKPEWPVRRPETSDGETGHHRQVGVWGKQFVCLRRGRRVTQQVGGLDDTSEGHQPCAGTMQAGKSMKPAQSAAGRSAPLRGARLRLRSPPGRRERTRSAQRVPTSRTRSEPAAGIRHRDPAAIGSTRVARSTSRARLRRLPQADLLTENRQMLGLLKTAVADRQHRLLRSRHEVDARHVVGFGPASQLMERPERAGHPSGTGQRCSKPDPTAHRAAARS